MVFCVYKLCKLPFFCNISSKFTAPNNLFQNKAESDEKNYLFKFSFLILSGNNLFYCIIIQKTNQMKKAPFS
jgi:hypothetical protein